jgi:hypothetical protein
LYFSVVAVEKPTCWLLGAIVCWQNFLFCLCIIILLFVLQVEIGSKTVWRLYLMFTQARKVKD